jgi:hypothetical protein
MMQTAKSLDKGERDISVGIGGYAAFGDPGIAPDFMLRQGISDKSDFGVGYTLGLNGHVRLDWKREIWSNPTGKMYLSSGAALDLFSPNDFSGDPFFIGIAVPLYYSFNHGKKVVPYFGQKFSFGLRDVGVFKFYKNDTPPLERVNFYHQMFYTGAAGVRFGEKRIKWFLEASYIIDINRSFSQFTAPDVNGVEEWLVNKRFDSNLAYQFTIGMTIARKKK